jgi:hypothetical protein
LYVLLDNESSLMLRLPKLFSELMFVAPEKLPPCANVRVAPPIRGGGEGAGIDWTTICVGLYPALCDQEAFTWIDERIVFSFILY